VRTSSLAIHRQLVFGVGAGAVLPRYSGSDLLELYVLKWPKSGLFVSPAPWAFERPGLHNLWRARSPDLKGGLQA